MKRVAQIPNQHQTKSALLAIAPSSTYLDISSLLAFPASALRELLEISTQPRYFSTMFGGKSFNPKTDIPNLAGKVILVTGGKYSFTQVIKV